jgi:hypothetical protein
VAGAVGVALTLAPGAWPALTLAAGLALVALRAWRPLRRVARIPAPVRAELLWRRSDPPAPSGLVLAAAGTACLTVAVALRPWAPPLWAVGSVLLVAAAGRVLLRRRPAKLPAHGGHR